MTRIAHVFAAAALAAGIAAAGEHGSKVASTPQWEKLKTLVGEWDSSTVEGAKKPPTHLSVRMTGGGSAMMHWMAAGTPHEMVTMFAMDKDDLLATHYCAAHNQPRMRAVPGGTADRIAFEFKDGTNIRPGDGYMGRLVLTFVDADHHDEEWGYVMDGKLSSDTFHYTRVATAAK